MRKRQRGHPQKGIEVIDLTSELARLMIELADEVGSPSPNPKVHQANLYRIRQDSRHIIASAEALKATWAEERAATRAKWKKEDEEREAKWALIDVRTAKERAERSARWAKSDPHWRKQSERDAKEHTKMQAKLDALIPAD